MARKAIVVLFHDTFNNYNTPNVAMAATRFLEKSGYRVVLVGQEVLRPADDLQRHAQPG